MNKQEFPCGCTIPIIDGKPQIDFYNLTPDNYKCDMVWDMLCTGKTKGVFQLDSQHGQNWCAKLRPRSLEEMSDLSSLIRPGCIHAMLDDKSMTQTYIDRKNGGDPVTYLHQSLEPILKETYGVLTFQEQSMRIATDIAGFSQQEADSLRKGLGKKLADVVAKNKILFVDKAAQKGIVNKEEAEEIFGWIEKGNRYLFNKCLNPNTVVETKNGSILLSELNVGDFVNTPDGFVEVCDIINTGIQDLYEVTMESGKTIECTLEHKFLCEDKIIRPLIDIIAKNYKIICESE